MGRKAVTTLKTGSKGFTQPLRARAGFTFIEVMVTAAVLSLGTVMIQGGLLRAADLLNRYSNTLVARQWMDERLWQTQETLFYSGEDAVQSTSGSFTKSGREFDWELDARLGSGKDLYRIRLSVSWSQGGRPLQVIKEIYAAK